MYEAVHTRPEGPSTAARLARTAAEYGYEGIVLRNHGDARPGPAVDADRLREAVGIDVVEGVEIRAEDSSTASGYLGSHRPERTLVLVHGGTPAINAFAVEQDRVDVLAHPMREGGDLNHVLVRKAAEHQVCLEVDLSSVLRGTGGNRVRAIGRLRKLRELIEHYDAPYVVSGDPTGHLQLRAPRELIALGETVGFEADTIRRGLRTWGRLATRNRERLSEDYLGPGVRRGRHPDPEGTDGEVG